MLETNLKSNGIGH